MVPRRQLGHQLSVREPLMPKLRSKSCRLARFCVHTSSKEACLCVDKSSYATCTRAHLPACPQPDTFKRRQSHSSARGSVVMWTRAQLNKLAASSQKSDNIGPICAAARASAASHRVQPPHLPLLGSEIDKQAAVCSKTAGQPSHPHIRLSGEISEGR